MPQGLLSDAIKPPQTCGAAKGGGSRRDGGDVEAMLLLLLPPLPHSSARAVRRNQGEHARCQVGGGVVVAAGGELGCRGERIQATSHQVIFRGIPAIEMISCVFAINTPGIGQG